MNWEVREGDCVEAMRAMPEASVDSIVCDPPYGLEFMGKDWDKFATGRSAGYSKGGEMAAAPGGTGRSQDKGDFSWFGSAAQRPQYTNRPAKRCGKCGKQAWSGSPCQCEQPEWIMDNSTLHTYQAWCEAWAREALRVLKPGGHLLAFGGTRTIHRLVCAIEDAGFEIRDCLAWLYGSGFPKSHNLEGEWQGWGTALKPAHEPIVMARKPLAGTVAANVLEHGTGALNVDGCRIVTTSADRDEMAGRSGVGKGATSFHSIGRDEGTYEPHEVGRWPANVLLDEQAAEMLDEQTGELTSGEPGIKRGGNNGAAYGAESRPPGTRMGGVWRLRRCLPLPLREQGLNR